jgi:type II secretory pathway pseudopilin PulG
VFRPPAPDAQRDFEPNCEHKLTISSALAAPRAQARTTDTDVRLDQLQQQIRQLSNKLSGHNRQGNSGSSLAGGAALVKSSELL